jgi:glutamyl-tRNA synthetase
MNDTSTIRLRFAPSPTGYLHVGGARTALFNWLWARHAGGVFVLRIEDTDQLRNQPEMTQAILDGMTWLGLDWDEGPYFQTDGLARHQRDTQRLLENGHAYRCFCTAEQIEARRAQPGATDERRYDRYCLLHVPIDEAERRAASGESHTLRFRVPDGMTAWVDIVHGPIEFDNTAIEDFIVLRSNGTPIYNMAVVSDDLEHRITHVVRGADHISNTPKQIMLYDALREPRPVFGHVPLILGPDGKRLSKRHGATAVDHYEKLGILPDAMVNFLALLGWAPGTDQEFFTRDELIAAFTIEAVNRKAAVFDTQKLSWLNGQHLARRAAADLAPRVSAELIARGATSADALKRDTDWLHALIDTLKVRARSINEIVDLAMPYFGETVTWDMDAARKNWKDPATADRLQRLRDAFARVDSWNESSLEPVLRALADELAISAGKLIHPLRVALSGQAAGPGIFEVAVLVGRDRSLRRMDAAIAHLHARESDGSPA